MRRLLLCATLVACESAYPEPRFTVMPLVLLDEVPLTPVSWEDEALPWTPIGIINDSYFPLNVEIVESSGDLANLLELSPGVYQPQTIGLRESTTLRVRLRLEGNDRTLWSSGTVQGLLRLTVGGNGVIDSETGEADPAGYRVVEVDVPISAEFHCDLDGDGFDAFACAGTDCNDKLAAVGPGADEVCDGFDNNCSGVVDEGCAVD